MSVTDNGADIRERACEWVALMNSGEATPEDRRRFDVWMNADPAHAAAARRIDGVWRDVSGMEQLRTLISGEGKSGRAQNWIAPMVRLISPIGIGAAMAASLALVIAVAVWRPQAPLFSPAPADYATTIAELRDIQLEDGSQVTLGARSELDVAFTEFERRVTLRSGEAFFSVAKDETRPFFVAAGDTVVRVVGTKFDVRRGVEEVRVSVVEGIVEVGRGETFSASGGAPARAKTITAGQRIVSVAGANLVTAKVESVTEPAAWRDGRLVYNNVALREVVADANRYYDGEIILASDELAELGVTAGFRTEQIDQLIDSLAFVLELDVERPSDGRVILRQSRANG